MQEMVDEAMRMDNGDATYKRYAWKETGATVASNKIVALTCYKPWKWVIGASAYEDDFSGSRIAVKSALRDMLAITAAGAAALLIIFAGISIYMSNRIVKPISIAAAMLKDIAQGEGDLTKRLSINTKDEMAELAKWFNVFIDKLQNDG